ncbi:hypothetical protein, partial [Klebsiella aerogenes]|uniref:hypothetical protein n=1 Tax=Klebsiella aerogenes TaxID=548 RepID=UPI001CC765BB
YNSVFSSTVRKSRNITSDEELFLHNRFGIENLFHKNGPTNLADYWTKHHCAAHHVEKRPQILTPLFIHEAFWASTK